MIWIRLSTLFSTFFIALLKAARHNAEVGCQLPERWSGAWFQSGVRQPIVIDRTRISNKGRCFTNDGDKFHMFDDKSMCYRCVVIHEKHENVLQYKETFCVHTRDSLHSLCQLITGDALLFSMFREEGVAVPCPFRGGHTFTYNRGHGECRYPLSTIDSCTHESRLLFQYHACPDVHATESAVEELQCLATWKEGSLRYLVGKVHHSHATSNEERFRCFVWEKVTANDADQLIDEGSRPRSPDDVSADYRVAQSGDATCNGLFSPLEGSKTMTLKKAPATSKCRYPPWLTTSTHWHTLDYSRTYLFHHRNTTLHIANTTNSNSDGGGAATLGNTAAQQLTAAHAQSLMDGQQDIRLVCTELKAVSTEVAQLVGHYTMGCQNGFMCMMFYKRDSHVIELQTGTPTKRLEEACTSAYFDRSSAPYITLVTTNPEQRKCPHFGRYSVSGVTRRDQRRARSHEIQSHPIDLIGTLSHGYANQNYRRSAGSRNLQSFGDDDDGCSLDLKTLVVGCSASDTMEFRSDCDNSPDKPRVTSVYQCHGGWVENGTHYLITTPLSRSSRGARRYCFAYEATGGSSASVGLGPPAGASVIRFSTSSNTCTRDSASTAAGASNVLAFNITNQGQCTETSSSTRLEPSALLHLTALLQFLLVMHFANLRLHSPLISHSRIPVR
ncbi:hypothetical protein LSTR_LSTR010506 [Laodelphax striatellus]|uniref:Uncharacterized protein n=1 Tax=Laodelphax striatellus TaxID=195883 RepID=A0A482WR70_LAOST|nr:hypothetical protein LSTR_LSTR010506 [Laodelphax striatellus]